MRGSRSSVGYMVAPFLAGVGSAFVLQLLHARYCTQACPLCNLFRPKAPTPAPSGCGSSDPNSRCANCTCWKSRAGPKADLAVTKSGRVTLNVDALTTLQELNQEGGDDISGYLST